MQIQKLTEKLSKPERINKSIFEKFIIYYNEIESKIKFGNENQIT